MDGQFRNPAVNSSKSSFATVGIAAVSTQGPDAFNYGCKTAEYFSDIFSDKGIEISTIWRKSKRLFHRIEKALNILLLRQVELKLG